MPAAFQVEGLKEFTAELKAIDPKWGPALTKLNRVIAKEAAEGAAGIALGMGGQQAAAAGAITGTSNSTEARISVGKNPGFAGAAFWGARRHTGWYAKKQYDASVGKQFAPWVGNTWEAAAYQGGPYALNRALYFDLPLIMEHYKVMLTELTAQAFPL